MSPQIAAIIGTVLAVLFHPHLIITSAGCAVSLSVPVLIAAVLVLAAVVLLWMLWRSLRGFRSTPYPRSRPVSNWSNA